MVGPLRVIYILLVASTLRISYVGTYIHTHICILLMLLRVLDPRRHVTIARRARLSRSLADRAPLASAARRFRLEQPLQLGDDLIEASSKLGALGHGVEVAVVDCGACACLSIARGEARGPKQRGRGPCESHPTCSVLSRAYASCAPSAAGAADHRVWHGRSCHGVRHSCLPALRSAPQGATRALWSRV